ncbi:hypothetical protein OF829_13675 [Sphingomonas sp. LB-2]|uniref:hypothetical protein n=1 Tax=Sphingomonas caeni TaxID=2984949 RepID=UPI00222F7274|nr:hypothetical protein [Sphingomonas caeni]MCW3848290.1 hypothetical protein [Sphingomonas caeni]
MKNFRASGAAAVAAAIALIATSAIPAAAATRDPTTDAPAKQERVAPKPAQKYCIKDDVTGSRVPRTVCKTRADWIAEDGFDPLAQR